MASNTGVIIKRSFSTAIPPRLDPGELAYSYVSNVIFVGSATGDGVLNIGGYYYTQTLDNATANNVPNTLVRRDANGNFVGGLTTIDGLTPGYYGGTTQIPVIKVAANGRIMAVSNTHFSQSDAANLVNGSYKVRLGSDGNLNVPRYIIGANNQQLTFDRYNPSLPSTNFFTLSANNLNDLNGFQAQEGDSAQAIIYTEGDIWFYANTNGITPGWKFGADANTIFPGGATIGDAYRDGGTTLRSAANGQYVLIASNDLAQYVQVDNNNVYIGTNFGLTNNNWTFDKSGKTTFPGGATVSNNSIITASTLVGVHADTTGNQQVFLQGDGVFVQTFDGVNYHTFQHDTAGRFVLPGASTLDDVSDVFSFYIKPSNVNQTLKLYSSDNNVGVDVQSTALYISTNRNTLQRTWSFDAEGYLNFPDSTAQNTAFTGTAIDQYARNTANNVTTAIDQTARNKANSASSNTIYTQGVDTSQNTRINAAFSAANTAAANTVYQQSVNNLQNTSITIIQGVDVGQNAAITAIQGVDLAQNTNITIIQGVDVGQNAAISVIQGVDLTQNSAITAIQGVDLAQNTNITAVNTYAASAFGQANAAFTQANVGASFVNTGGTVSGNVTITKDLSVTGNLYILGNTTTINTSSFAVQDSLIVLAVGNYSTDILDIGFAGHYNNGTNAHTGIIRDSSVKEFFVFDGYTPELTSNNNIDINDASFNKANLNAKIFKGNLIGSTAVVNGLDLYNYVTSSYAKANTVGTLGQAAFDAANTAAANTVYQQSVNNTQNTNITAVNTFAGSAYNQANAANSLAQSGYNTANTAAANTVYQQGVNDSQNTNITAVNTYAASAYAQANATNNLTQSAYNAANTAAANTVYTQGVDNTQNTNITAVNTFAGSAYAQANATNNLATSAYAAANTAASNTVYTQGVDATQNTNITAVNTFAGSAYAKANSANVLAQAAFDKANNSITADQYARDTANSASANTIYQQGVNNTQNTNITAVNTYATSGYNQANTATTLAQASFDKANSSITADQFARDTANTAAANTVYLSGVNITQNNSISAVNNYSFSAYAQANATNNLTQSAYNQANTASSNTVYQQGVNDYQNTYILSVNTYAAGAFSKANSATTLAQAAFDKANTDNSQAQAAFDAANTAAGNTVYLQSINNLQNTAISAAFNQANTASSNTVYLSGALNTVNSSITIIQGVDVGQNAAITAIQGVDLAQNTNITAVNTYASSGYGQANAAFTAANTAAANTVYTQGVDATQNTNISAVNTFAASGYNTANTAAANTIYIQGVDLTQNAAITVIQGVDLGQNAAITIIQGVDLSQNNSIASLNTYAIGAFVQANAANNLAQSAYNAANTVSATTVYQQGVNDTQNTNIVAVNTFASSGYNKANSANNLAQAAYDKANTAAAGSFDQFARDTANTAAANTVYLQSINNNQNTSLTVIQGVDLTQNTRITAVEYLSTSAYVQANAAFNQANVGATFVNNGGTVSGNVSILGNLSVTGNISYTGNVTSVSVTGNTGQFFGYAANGFNALYAGIPTGYLTEPQMVFQVSSNYNGYAGINFQNINRGSLSSADLYITADNGSANDTFLDIGLASSSYSYPGYALIKPNDGYWIVYGNTTTGGGNAIIATGLTNDIIFATNGVDDSDVVMRITSSNNVVIRSTNPTTSTTSGALQVAGGIGTQGDVQSVNVYSRGTNLLEYIQNVNNVQNTSITAVSTYSVSGYGQANAAFVQANAANNLAQSAYNSSNNNSTSITYIQGVDLAQNTNITAVNTFAGSAYNKANSANVLAQAAYDKANSAASGSFDQYARDTANSAAANTIYTQGVDLTQNTNISAVNTFAGSSYLQANAAYIQANAAFVQANATNNFAQSGYNAANTAAANTVYLQAVNNLQNTNITAVNTYATSAYNQGNSTSILAQAAFDKANSAASSSLDQYARNTANSASSNTIYTQGVDATQNTNIQSAWNKANNSLPLTGGTIAGDVTSNNFTANIAVTTPLVQALGGSFYPRIDLDVTGGVVSIGGNGTPNETQFLSSGAIRLPTIATIMSGTSNSSQIVLTDTAQFNSLRGDVIKIQTGTAGTVNNTWQFSNNKLIFPDNTYQNTAFTDSYVSQIGTIQTNIIAINNYSTSAYAQANAATVLAQASYDKANSISSGTVDQFARNTGNNATVLAQAAFDKANTGSSTGADQYARNTANTAAANTVYLQAVNNLQNTNITSATSLAQAAFNKANTPSSAPVQVDDISFQFDGLTTSFTLSSDGTSLSPGNPNNLSIYIGGIQVFPTKYAYDYFNLPEIAVFNSGFKLSGNTITFATAPSKIMNFYGLARSDISVSFAYKQTPFTALNIMLGP